jgi:hypothetical protein
MASKKKNVPKVKKPPGKIAPSADLMREASCTIPGASDSPDRICWRFSHFDWDGPWGSLDLNELVGRLRSFESNTILELFNHKDEPGKRYDLPALPNKVAVARLDAIGLGDQDHIWRLRTTNTGRLYGFLVHNVFHPVFWDPEHEIWPSPKRHT